MRIGLRRPRYSPVWIREIEISLPLYGLPGQAGSVWTERRATGDLRGLEYGDAEASLYVITSALPGPDLRLQLVTGGRPTAVPVNIGGQMVTFYGLVAADSWAARADFAGYCVSVFGVGWPVSGLVLEAAAGTRRSEEAD